MKQFSPRVRDFMGSLAMAYQDLPETPQNIIMDGILVGLLVSAHRPTFAGNLLEELSEKKDDFKLITNYVIRLADASDQE